MSKFCVKKPFFVLVAVIVVLIIGGVSLSKMQTDLLPDMEVPYLIVVTTEPGASPEKVETDVTKPMENALGVISGVKNVTTRPQPFIFMCQVPIKQKSLIPLIHWIIREVQL